jgi:hypothetical protein
VVAERAFDAPLAGLDISFKHELGVRGDTDVNRPALDNLQRLLTQEPGKEVLAHDRR